MALFEWGLHENKISWSHPPGLNFLVVYNHWEMEIQICILPGFQARHLKRFDYQVIC
jgi:hypothetical protein